jgi:hypothetical protein
MIIKKVPYTDKQLFMDVINLLTHCRMYMHNMGDWDRRADADKIWLHLHPFIQMAYQRHLQTGNTTAAQGDYTNRYTGLSAEDEVYGNDTAETIAGMINLHMANLSAQTTASIEASTAQINVSLQQLAANNNQLNLQQQAILQQIMAMLSTNPPHTAIARTFVPPAPHIFSPSPLQGYQPQYQKIVQQLYQQQYRQCRGGRGSGSQGGHACCAQGGGGWGQLAPVQYVGVNPDDSLHSCRSPKSPTPPPALHKLH